MGGASRLGKGLVGDDGDGADEGGAGEGAGVPDW